MDISQFLELPPKFTDIINNYDMTWRDRPENAGGKMYAIAVISLIG